MFEPAGLPGECNSRDEVHGARAGRRRKVVRGSRRRAAGSSHAARNGSPEWEIIYPPHQRAQTRSDQTQDQETAETWGVVNLNLARRCSPDSDLLTFSSQSRNFL